MSQLARAEVAHSTLTPDAMLSWAAPLIVILAASALVWATSRNVQPALRARLLLGSASAVALCALLLAASLSGAWLIHTPPLHRWMSGHRRDLRVPDWLGLVSTLWLALVAVRSVGVARRLRATRAFAHAARNRLDPLPARPFDVRVAESPMPAAATLPGKNPVIVVSRGLVELLDEDGLRIVLGHEFAHAKFRHDLYRVGCGLLLTLGRVFRPWTDSIGFALERWADESCVRSLGTTPNRVASTIALVGLRSSGFDPLASHFGGDDPVRRVDALLRVGHRPTESDRNTLILGVSLLAISIAGASTVVQAHHAVTLFRAFCG